MSASDVCTYVVHDVYTAVYKFIHVHTCMIHDDCIYIYIYITSIYDVHYMYMYNIYIIYNIYIYAY